MDGTDPRLELMDDDDPLTRWPTEFFTGLTVDMIAELRRLSKWRFIGPTEFTLAREYEERSLSRGPVRAVLPGSCKPGIRLGILVVTDEDVVAYGYGPGDTKESVVVAKEWISSIDLRWRSVSGRLTIHLHDSGGRHESRIKLEGILATAETAERWRSAALS
ncbi:hypothetical protein ABIB25_005765 [Nakamurella sp. UYEF19]|uniref:hypothetical protein n=1 Tax=Nakamurella sp. UYEF19 TaxID=1756392 RepID=UPI003397CD1D